MGHRTALFTALVLAAVTIPPAPAASAINEWACAAPPDAGFTDVDPASVHKTDIDCLKDLSLTVEEGTFRPRDPVRRDEMALFLQRMSLSSFCGSVSTQGGLPRLAEALAAGEGACFADLSTPFTDLDGVSEEAVLSVGFLYEFGITRGATATTYAPAQHVARWQMALFLTRLTHAMTGSLPSGADHGFEDIASLPDVTRNAINQLAQLGITSGTAPGEFDPFGLVTREQMASFIMRTYVTTLGLPIVGFAIAGGECSSDFSECSHTTNFPTTSGFVLRPGAIADHPFVSAEAETALMGADAVILLDGVEQESTEWTVIKGDRIIRWWEVRFPTGLPAGTATIEIRHMRDGVVTSSYQLTLNLQ